MSSGLPRAVNVHLPDSFPKGYMDFFFEKLEPKARLPFSSFSYSGR